MDTLTHALSGALVARATAPEPGPGTLPVLQRCAVGMMAAAFPDLDFVAGYVSPVFYLEHHRGVTHSLVMLPLWAALIAWICTLIWRRDRNWRAYFGVAALGVGIHIAGDVITAYGTMIFAPLSDARIGWATTFIIDPWFTGIIVAGLLVSLIWRRSRLPAAAGMAVLAGYVGWQALLQQEAVEFGRAYARDAGYGQPRVTAQPRPASPLNWMVTVEQGERLDYAMVHLARGAAPQPLPPDAGYIRRLASHYLPLDHAQWVKTLRFGGNAGDAALAREAWSRPELGFFRWFAQFPVLYRVDRGNPLTCAWFQDLRFFTPGRDVFPFRYGLCREAGGPWRLHELAGESTRISIQ